MNVVAHGRECTHTGGGLPIASALSAYMVVDMMASKGSGFGRMKCHWPDPPVTDHESTILADAV